MRRFIASILVLCEIMCGCAALADIRIPKVDAIVSSIAKAPRPKALVILNPVKRIPIDGKLALKCAITPAGANQDVMWYTSNTVAEVSAEGVVTPKRVGKVRITARARAKLAIMDRFILEVYDPDMPTSISVSPKAAVLLPGETIALSVSCVPETADKSVEWSSSDPTRATVNENGIVTAVSFGQVTITAKAKNGGATAKCDVAVVSNTLTDVVPARTTLKDAQAVRDNLDAINSIYATAAGEVTRLAAKGNITIAERTRRLRMINNAFDMYRFTWYTDARVRYWTSAYAGQKDFYPGKVYFGLPYIQSGRSGSRVNRRFNVNKAVSAGYYVKAQTGLYKISAKRLDGSYVGNDCSAFTGMSTFVGNGYSVGNGVCFMLTSSIISSSLYRTVDDFDDLRPGDTIVRGHDHAVMFLYYTDAAKTRMMIIEQGGGTNLDMHNTVACSVVNRSKYETKYTIRRARFLAV